MFESHAFAALRHGEYRSLLGASFLFTVALQVQEIALGYKLYTLTHQPLVLGLLGLSEALPFIALALFGGHTADRGDRRAIALVSVGFVTAGSAALMWASLPRVSAHLSRDGIVYAAYAVMAALGLGRGFFSPAVTALRPVLVPRELYPNAAAWSSAAWQAGAILGPVVSGYLYAWVGLTGTLALVVGLLLASMLLFSTIHARPAAAPADGRASLWSSLAEGIRYVRRTKIILYSISLDMFSVLFGGVVAILPVYATDVLHVGAEGLGVLRSASSVGAIMTVLVCTRFPPTHRPWRNLLIAIAGFGVGTLVFAVSQQFWLSAVALFATGAFDSISVVVRNTLMQSLVPDHLRGRVLSVNSIFITTSNELGAFESGTAAQLLGTVPSVVAGGIVTLLTVIYVGLRSKDLFSVRVS
jgi:MFS family permease